MAAVALFTFELRGPADRAPMRSATLAAGVVLLHAVILALLLMARAERPSFTAIVPLMWVTVRELPQLPREPQRSLPSPAFSAPSLSFPLPSVPEAPPITTPWVSKGLELPLSAQDCEQTPPDRRLIPCAKTPARAVVAQPPPLSEELMLKFAHDKEVEDSPLAAPCFSQKLQRFSSRAC